MATNPLSYPCWKFIVQYIEPNTRFEISRRIPAMRSNENLVPLQIDTLKFYNDRTVVNDVAYEFQVLRIFRAGEQPYLLRRENERGERSHDYDQHGLKDVSVKDITTPGDVRIRDLSLGHVWNDGQLFATLESQLREAEQEMARRRGENVADLEIPEYHYLYDLKEFSDERLQQRIDDIQYKLIPYYSRRDGVPLPYDFYIRMTVLKGERVQKVEYLTYERRMYKALKHINSAFFANRPTISVKQFEIKDASIVIRLPIDVKFRFRKLGICGAERNVFVACENIFDKSSFPLQVLHTHFTHFSARDLEHKNVREADKLVLKPLNHADLELDTLKNFTNREVYHKYGGIEYDVHFYVGLVKHWFESDRRIGSYFSFEISDEWLIAKLFERIRREFVGHVERKRKIRIPTIYNSEIHVSYSAIPNPEKRAYLPEWLLKIKVMAMQ